MTNVVPYQLPTAQLRALADRLERGDPPGVSPHDLAREDLLQLQSWLREQNKCAALTTPTGWPCRKWTKVGFSTCSKHSPKTASTLGVAERALAAVRMPAISWIADAIDAAEAQNPCPTCGYPRMTPKERKRIDALAIRVLDRTGLGPTSKLMLERPQDDAGLPLGELTTAENAELESILASMDEFRGKVQARLARRVVQVLAEPASLPAPAAEPQGPAPGPGLAGGDPPAGGEGGQG